MSLALSFVGGFADAASSMIDEKRQEDSKRQKELFDHYLKVQLPEFRKLKAEALEEARTAEEFGQFLGDRDLGIFAARNGIKRLSELPDFARTWRKKQAAAPGTVQEQTQAVLGQNSTPQDAPERGVSTPGGMTTARTPQLAPTGFLGASGGISPFVSPALPSTPTLNSEARVTAPVPERTFLQNVGASMFGTNSGYAELHSKAITELARMHNVPPARIQEMLGYNKQDDLPKMATGVQYELNPEYLKAQRLEQFDKEYKPEQFRTETAYNIARRLAAEGKADEITGTVSNDLLHAQRMQLENTQAAGRARTSELEKQQYRYTELMKEVRAFYPDISFDPMTNNYLYKGSDLTKKDQYINKLQGHQAAAGMMHQDFVRRGEFVNPGELAARSNQVNDVARGIQQKVTAMPVNERTREAVNQIAEEATRGVAEPWRTYIKRQLSILSGLPQASQAN